MDLVLVHLSRNIEQRWAIESDNSNDNNDNKKDELHAHVQIVHKCPLIRWINSDTP